MFTVKANRKAMGGDPNGNWEDISSAITIDGALECASKIARDAAWSLYKSYITRSDDDNIMENIIICDMFTDERVVFVAGGELYNLKDDNLKDDNLKDDE